MIRRVECQIQDVSALDLGVRWNGPLPELLAHTKLAGAESTLQLGVIGASHVVTVGVTALPDAVLFREEISCTARSEGQALPAEAEFVGYRLQSTVSVLDDAAFNFQAEHIAALGDSGALVVQFPGEGEHHLTAINGAATDDGWEWASYHLYPAENTIVTTWSRFTLPPGVL